MNAIHLSGLSCRTSSVVDDADGGRTRIFEVTTLARSLRPNAQRTACTVDKPPTPTAHFNEFRIASTGRRSVSDRGGQFCGRRADVHAAT